MGFSTSRNKANSIKSFVHGHFNLIIFKKLEACFVCEHFSCNKKCAIIQYKFNCSFLID